MNSEKRELMLGEKPACYGAYKEERWRFPFDLRKASQDLEVNYGHLYFVVVGQRVSARLTERFEAWLAEERKKSGEG